MRIVFLFPGSSPYEALDNWVFTIGRHTRHDVFLTRRPRECSGFECAFVLTEANSYPKELVDSDLEELRLLKIPFGVIHNNDTPGKRHGHDVTGIPTPGYYPSFCWTQRGQDRLAEHRPTLLRQPVLLPIVPPYRAGGLLIGTFGHIEPKKQTFEMNRWARKHGIPFIAVGPDVLAKEYETYLADLRSFGCNVQLHPWKHEIEELASSLAPCSHLMFVLTDSKKGTGGSPTSPRFAGLFNRPIIVVDDEKLFEEDGYHVFKSLGEIPYMPEALEMLKGPNYAWSPDAYLDALTERTLDFWRKS